MFNRMSIFWWKWYAAVDGTAKCRQIGTKLPYVQVKDSVIVVVIVIPNQRLELWPYLPQPFDEIPNEVKFGFHPYLEVP